MHGGRAYREITLIIIILTAERAYGIVLVLIVQATSPNNHSAYREFTIVLKELCP